LDFYLVKFIIIFFLITRFVATYYGELKMNINKNVHYSTKNNGFGITIYLNNYTKKH